ncbi:hypothetical protein [Dactylosporangium sp. NPDC005555]|uniref:hypothetical protein n=1 Tax=Dactylosporangium sp. NPDC005555 TaxID=3154889 RepID=UPI0033B6586B
MLIHDTATGKVDVANALRMAEECSGVTAPRTVAPAQVPHQPPGDYPETFNRL